MPFMGKESIIGKPDRLAIPRVTPRIVADRDQATLCVVNGRVGPCDRFIYVRISDGCRCWGGNLGETVGPTKSLGLKLPWIQHHERQEEKDVDRKLPALASLQTRDKPLVQAHGVTGKNLHEHPPVNTK